MDKVAIKQIAAAVVQMQESIETFYRDDPERRKAAQEWYDRMKGGSRHVGMGAENGGNH